jgi:DNA polymerase IV
MDLPINTARPQIMHVDLNSCFATVEQQANPLLRGKPMAVAAYGSPNGCILAASIEAKTYGIKTGMRIRDARILYPKLIVRAPDPDKYRDVHKRFMNIFTSYSPKVCAKSIDEAIIDFSNTQKLNYDLINVAKKIKARMKDEIGEWIMCSIGIATNRSLAKLAAGYKKPDGLTVIDHTNLIEIYKNIELMDFCGINTRYKARLNVNGIFTAMDFFEVSQEKLSKQIFRSVIGKYWYERLRGWETDDVSFETKTIGHQYALKIPTNNDRELSKLNMKLCEKMGRRMRRQGYRAKGIHVACSYKGWGYWHKAQNSKSELYTTLELYRKALAILNERPKKGLVTKLSVNCYALTNSNFVQSDLFAGDFVKKRKASDALDKINDMYGEFTIAPALMMNMDKVILDRIAFGQGGIRNI